MYGDRFSFGYLLVLIEVGSICRASVMALCSKYSTSVLVISSLLAQKRMKCTISLYLVVSQMSI